MRSKRATLFSPEEVKVVVVATTLAAVLGWVDAVEEIRLVLTEAVVLDSCSDLRTLPDGGVFLRGWLAQEMNPASATRKRMRIGIRCFKKTS